MRFIVKLYPQTILSENYSGNFDFLFEQIKMAGISGVIVPVFQGSRLLFETPGQNDSAAGHNFLLLQEKAQEHGVGFIPEFPVFHDPDTYQALEQYRPVNLERRVGFDSDWYAPICPSNEHYRNYRLGLIKDALRLFEPAIFSLDFLHYPYLATASQHVSPSSVPDFCHCDFCQYQFAAFSGRENPMQDMESWYRFRAENLTIVPVLLSEDLERRGEKSSIMVQVPPVAFDSSVEALRRLTGQDLQQWRNIVDVVSPHMYLNQTGFGPDWALNNLAEIINATEMQVTPEIDLPQDATEFTELLVLHDFLDELQDGGVKAVSIFHWGAIEENPDIMEVLAEFSGEDE